MGNVAQMSRKALKPFSVGVFSFLLSFFAYLLLSFMFAHDNLSPTRTGKNPDDGRIRKSTYNVISYCMIRILSYIFDCQLLGVVAIFA